MKSALLILVIGLGCGFGGGFWSGLQVSGAISSISNTVEQAKSLTTFGGLIDGTKDQD